MGPDLLSWLDIAVYARTATDRYEIRGEAPEWLRAFDSNAQITELFPYLEVFLLDAEELWAGSRAGRLQSDIWTETDSHGRERRLRATAVRTHDEQLLLIEAVDELFAATQSLQQRAYDAKLAHDQIAKLSRELKRATDAKSEFLARMSHEIRTPMNAILGMADLLWETELSSEQREYVRIFRRAGDNLLALINDILDLSKVEAGMMELEKIEFDLAEVLEKASEIIAVKAHAKGLELSCRLAPGVPQRVLGDPGKLRQIILNLLGNSIKFTERGELAVTVERDPVGLLLFTVRDTGIGIPADKVSSIFESFSQVDSSVTRKFGGTGLGLSISKKFVEMMGGRIWVESTLGVGSEFKFAAALEAAPAVAPPPGYAGLHCLIVDDSASHRAAVRDLLAAWGATAVDCDGPSAIATLRSRSPWDVLLIDARMPDADGFRLAQQMRAITAGQAQVLMMVTTDRPVDASQARELGLRTVLKPVRRSELLEVRRGESDAAPVGTPAAELPRIRILLADDSEDNRFLIRSYLRSAPVVLDEAADGREAVTKFVAARYQLVLTDVEMPVLDGYSATREMRAWECEHNVRPTPILALTAHALTEATQKSLDAGCNAHLTKPIRKDALLDAIRKWALREEAPAPDPTKVMVDSSLEDIVPGYLENRRKDVVLLKGALENSDFAALRMIGHKIKGTGGGYGFPMLTELGAAIEDAALAQDRDTLSAKIEALGAYLSKVEVAYHT